MQFATIASLAAIAVSPFYTLLNVSQGLSFFSPAVLITFLLSPVLLAPFFILAGVGFPALAKIAFALGMNLICLGYSWAFSSDIGLYFYAPALGLLPFFVFAGNEKLKISAFIALPCVIFFVCITYFDRPLPGFGLGEATVRGSWLLNFMWAFVISVSVFAFQHSKVLDAERRLSNFSKSVSEYLDSSLVQRLRDGEPVGPTVRFLTVFFSDLIGSTRISFSMGNEQFGLMINEYVREMQEIIKSHDGFIEDVSGDGILGYVGNFDTNGPRVDAVKAVDMCVVMCERLSELMPRFQAIYGLRSTLRVRIGISSGDATVGRTSGARAIYTANGDVVNLGAKLEKKVGDIAADGGILVSEPTAELVREHFELVRHRIDIDGQASSAYLVVGRCAERLKSPQ